MHSHRFLPAGSLFFLANPADLRPSAEDVEELAGVWAGDVAAFARDIDERA